MQILLVFSGTCSPFPFSCFQALTNVSSVSVREAPWPSESMAQIASLLLEYHANPDSQDSAGYTPLQRAVEYKNEEVFTILLTNPV